MSEMALLDTREVLTFAELAEACAPDLRAGA